MAAAPAVTAATSATARQRSRVFVAVAAIVVLFLAASSAPSPLYVVYQQQWGFTATVLTVVFAIYVAGLLGSLLVVGALSDHLGRRPVLAASILLEIVALVLFLVAGDVVALAAARLVQGIATGAAITTSAPRSSTSSRRTRGAGRVSSTPWPPPPGSRSAHSAAAP
jgi:MFS family permease